MLENDHYGTTAPNTQPVSNTLKRHAGLQLREGPGSQGPFLGKGPENQHLYTTTCPRFRTFGHQKSPNFIDLFPSGKRCAQPSIGLIIDF